MRRFVFAACALAVVGITAPMLSNLSAQDTLGSPFTEVVKAPDKLAKSPEQARAELAKSYLELMKAQSELMTKKELEAAIAKATAENDRLEAQRELDKARAMLTEIAEKHPGTPAGRAAASGFNAIGQALSHGEATVIDDRPARYEPLTPQPDTGFRAPEASDLFSDPFDGLDFKPRTNTPVRSSKGPKKETRPSSGTNDDIFGEDN